MPDPSALWDGLLRAWALCRRAKPRRRGRWRRLLVGLAGLGIALGGLAWAYGIAARRRLDLGIRRGRPWVAFDHAGDRYRAVLEGGPSVAVYRDLLGLIKVPVRRYTLHGVERPLELPAIAGDSRPSAHR